MAGAKVQPALEERVKISTVVEEGSDEEDEPSTAEIKHRRQRRANKKKMTTPIANDLPK